MGTPDEARSKLATIFKRRPGASGLIAQVTPPPGRGQSIGGPTLGGPSSGVALTPKGAHALQRDPAAKLALLHDLCAGTESIEDYCKGVCYETVAFCWALHGKIAPDALMSTVGAAWIDQFAFTAGTLWTGGAMPFGAAVGFERHQRDGSTLFFHAAVALGGTLVRGVNSSGLTPGWAQEADLSASDVLAPATEPDRQGFYWQPLQQAWMTIWYV